MTFTALPTTWAGADRSADVGHAATHDAAHRAVNELKALTFNVLDYGALGNGTTDDVAGIRAAWAAAEAAAAGGQGVIVLFPGGYTFACANVLHTSAIEVLPDNARTRGKLTVRVEGTVQLSATTYQFMSPKTPTSVGDWCRNVRITGGGTIDCNNAGGNGHVIFGGYVAGGFLSQVNWEYIEIDNLRTVNVPTDSTPTPTTKRWNIWIGTNHGSAGLPLNTIENIAIHDLNLNGGNVGVNVAGVGSNVDGINIALDEVYCWNVVHDTGVVPTQYAAQNNFQFGSRGTGGKLRVWNCTGLNSGDDGFEVDQWQDAVVRDCLARDAGVCCFMATNFGTPTRIEDQRASFVNCRAEYVNLVPGSGSGAGLLAICAGFLFPNKKVGGSYLPFGTWEVIDCSVYYGQVPNTGTGAVHVPSITDTPNAPTSFKRLNIRNLLVVHKWAYAGTGTPTAVAVFVNGQGADSDRAHVSVRGLDMVANCSYNAASGALVFQGCSINSGPNGSGVNALLEDVAFDLGCNNTGSGLLSHFGLDSFGTSGYIPQTNVSITFRNWSWRRLSGFTTASSVRGVLVRGTAIAVYDRLTLEGMDFSRFDSLTTPADILIATGKQNKHALVYGHATNRWSRTNSFPATSVSPASSPWAWQNPTQLPVRLTVQGGVVTKVEQSSDAATYTDTGLADATDTITDRFTVLVPPRHTVQVTHTSTPASAFYVAAQ